MIDDVIGYVNHKPVFMSDVMPAETFIGVRNADGSVTMYDDNTKRRAPRFA